MEVDDKRFLSKNLIDWVLLFVGAILLIVIISKLAF